MVGRELELAVIKEWFFHSHFPQTNLFGLIIKQLPTKGVCGAIILSPARASQLSSVTPQV